MTSPDLMIFEPNMGGHHAEFTCHLLQYWRRHVPAGRLLAALPAGLLEQQADLSTCAIDPPRTSLALLPGPLPGPATSMIRKGRLNRQLLTDAIRRYRPRKVLLMYLDHAQLALATALRFPFPVRISGILFHPTLHYPAPPTRSPGLHFQRLRKRLILRLIARNPHLDTVFTLDPSAVPSLRLLGLDAVALADPVMPMPAGSSAPAAPPVFQGLEPGRKILLLFGALTARKGVIPLLQGLALLPAASARRIALVMVGPLDAELRSEVRRLAVQARDAGVQVIHHDAYIQSSAAQGIIRAADLVLAPYQLHFGSSAILIRAAQADRPVLSQAFGLMGTNVREHRLGQAVDAGKPAAIAAGIEAFMKNPSVGYDSNAARNFAAANTPDRFCAAIMARLAPGVAADGHRTLSL
jgi:glycosyltransferase involved in cell wall biosynthesis